MPYGVKDLIVYQKAFELAMDVFKVTKRFPSEEKYALTDQLRRSSRSVCRALGEGYRKRHYINHFVSKLSDADMENTETQVSLEFAKACAYISNEKYQELYEKTEEVGKILNHMINNPKKYSPKQKRY